ncbi:MAG: YhcH/YjgK/YiaL family protein [Bacteroidales bacterium]|nr:YhcH/YjgK/YiaL family protein [Bacteroidales bacterium]
MILDSLDNLHKYVALNPRIQTVVDFIKANDLAVVPSGKVQIDGDDVFGNFQTLKGKTKEEAKLETHNVMLDIQVPFNTAETMGFTPRRDLPQGEYNAENDITFYEGLAELYVTVHPGEFAIFLPQDGHAPCIAPGKEVQKVIFKVKL